MNNEKYLNKLWLISKQTNAMIENTPFSKMRGFVAITFKYLGKFHGTIV